MATIASSSPLADDDQQLGPEDDLALGLEASLGDWQRIRAALLYMGRDLQHRSFAVSAERRPLLWEEQDRCLALAERIDRLMQAGTDAAADSG
jgi:hypothetical protein